jgi:predicted enzyme related to lactoylglutathione lyase
MSNTENTTEECTMKQGKIGWNELVTSDLAGAIKFYTTMFGWETEKFQGGTGDYTMFKHDGQPFGGVMAAPHPGMPTHWTDYVIVDDLDASLAECASLGGKTCMGPMEIPNVGRIAIIQDPQGASIGLHQMPPNKGAGA